MASTARATNPTKYPTSMPTIQILKRSVRTRAAVLLKLFQNLLRRGARAAQRAAHPVGEVVEKLAGLGDLQPSRVFVQCRLRAPAPPGTWAARCPRSCRLRWIPRASASGRRQAGPPPLPGESHTPSEQPPPRASWGEFESPFQRYRKGPGMANRGVQAVRRMPRRHRRRAGRQSGT